MHSCWLLSPRIHSSPSSFNQTGFFILYIWNYSGTKSFNKLLDPGAPLIPLASIGYH